MSNVVNLDSGRPKLRGAALCLCCSHQWDAVADIGSVELKCPECNTWKGVFEGMTAPDTVVECVCGNQHFYLHYYDSSNYCGICAKCGLREVGYE